MRRTITSGLVKTDIFDQQKDILVDALREIVTRWDQCRDNHYSKDAINKFSDTIQGARHFLDCIGR